MVAVLAPLPALPAKVDLAQIEIWAHSASKDLLVMYSSHAEVAGDRGRKFIGDTFVGHSYSAAVVHCSGGSRFVMVHLCKESLIRYIMTG
jgi:hypothetical protein